MASSASALVVERRVRVVEHDVGMAEAEQGRDISTIQGGVGQLDRLDVLLRHRSRSIPEATRGTCRRACRTLCWVLAAMLPLIARWLQSSAT
jgi:hypothetical protein